MSIGPLLPGRIPGTLLADRLRQNLATSNRVLAYLQDQVATGQRFFRPGEDPSAAIRTILLQKAIERKTQLRANVDVDKSLLAATESSLATGGDALSQGKAYLLAGIGANTGPAEKQALAPQIENLL